MWYKFKLLSEAQLVWIQSFPLSQLPNQSERIQSTQSWEKKRSIRDFPKGISVKWNANSLV